ncbi:MAG TPA: MerR family transcriptional regulator [Longimicrobiales bacterium]|nr:MerR family transcriptional regulator [Longimicrobiales bacterium]
METKNGRETAVHPIGVVAARTGLTVDVLRVWQRRYGVVEPGRTESGQRLYSERDIERLRLLARATSAGRNIGQVSELTDDQLRELVRGDEAAARGPVPEDRATWVDSASLVERALVLTRGLDGAGLEALLRRVALVRGTPAFLDVVAAPLLRRVGEEWHAGRLSPAQEHLATGAVEAVLAVLRSELVSVNGAPGLVVATPAGEGHEVGALLVAAAGAAEGWRVTYLGANLPASEVASATLATSSRAAAMSVVYAPDPASVISEFRALRSLLPEHVTVLAGGAGTAGMVDELEAAGVLVLRDLDALRGWLRPSD